MLRAIERQHAVVAFRGKVLPNELGEMRDAGLVLRALVPDLAGSVLIVEIGNRDRERRGQGATARLKRERRGEQERERGFRAIQSFHGRSSLTDAKASPSRSQTEPLPKIGARYVKSISHRSH